MAFIIRDGCITCGYCVEVCEYRAIRDRLDTPVFYIHPKLCVECGRCVEICPVNVIEPRTLEDDKEPIPVILMS